MGKLGLVGFQLTTVILETACSPTGLNRESAWSLCSIYLLDWNTTTQTFIATAKFALEFEACKKKEGVVHSLVVISYTYKPISTNLCNWVPPSVCESHLT
jgi:hypothetical protein